MAEILIRAFDSFHKDELTDRRGCWKKGDIVEVREDGKVIGPHWGQSKERLPRFIVIRIPGAVKKDLEYLMDRWERNVALTQVSHDQLTNQFCYDVKMIRETTSLEEDILTKEQVNLNQFASKFSGAAETITNGTRVYITPPKDFDTREIEKHLESILKKVKRRAWKIDQPVVDEIIAEGGVRDVKDVTEFKKLIKDKRTL